MSASTSVGGSGGGKSGIGLSTGQSGATEIELINRSLTIIDKFHKELRACCTSVLAISSSDGVSSNSAASNGEVDDRDEKKKAFKLLWKKETRRIWSTVKSTFDLATFRELLLRHGNNKRQRITKLPSSSNNRERYSVVSLVSLFSF